MHVISLFRRCHIQIIILVSIVHGYSSGHLGTASRGLYHLKLDTLGVGGNRHRLSATLKTSLATKMTVLENHQHSVLVIKYEGADLGACTLKMWIHSCIRIGRCG